MGNRYTDRFTLEHEYYSGSSGSATLTLDADLGDGKGRIARIYFPFYEEACAFICWYFRMMPAPNAETEMRWMSMLREASIKALPTRSSIDTPEALVAVGI